MQKRFRFEKLEVWQEARRLNKSVYRLTSGFPKGELFGMTSQLRRASVSISTNIAEGSGRNSDKDFAHFLEIAYGSLLEVASLFYVALDEGYVKEGELERFFVELELLSKRVAALNRSLSIATTKTTIANPLRPKPSAIVFRP